MCGITGLVSFQNISNITTVPKKRVSRVKMYARLASQYMEKSTARATSRGRDAAGFMLASLPGDTTDRARLVVKKGPGVATSQAHKRTLDKEISDSYFSTQGLSITVHTRAATGASPKNNENNHPFISGNFVGVHNGILSNDRELAKKYALPLKGECDSEVLFALLDRFVRTEKMPLPDAVVRLRREVKGWYTIVFLDRSEVSKLYIVRHNSHLHLMEDTSARVMFFASAPTWITLPHTELLRKATDNRNTSAEGNAFLSADDLKHISLGDDDVFVTLDSLAEKFDSNLLVKIDDLETSSKVAATKAATTTALAVVA